MESDIVTDLGLQVGGDRNKLKVNFIVRQLRHHFGPFSPVSPVSPVSFDPHFLARPAGCPLLGDHGYRMPIGAHLRSDGVSKLLKIKLNWGFRYPRGSWSAQRRSRSVGRSVFSGRWDPDPEFTTAPREPRPCRNVRGCGAVSDTSTRISSTCSSASMHG